MANEFDILFKKMYRNGKITYMRITNYYHGVNIEERDIEFGKGIKIKEGRDLTIVVTGSQLNNVMKVLPVLQDKKVDAEVIYIHTIKPLDDKLICESIEKTKKVLIIEEHNEIGGLGDEVIRISKNILGVQYAQHGIPECIIHDYGTYQELCETLGFTPEGIINKIKTILKFNERRQNLCRK